MIWEHRRQQFSRYFALIFLLGAPDLNGCLVDIPRLSGIANEVVSLEHSKIKRSETSGKSDITKFWRKS